MSRGPEAPQLARGIILAYDAIRDPRDLAEVIHLAAGFGAEVHLIGRSIDPRHWKVVRKLRSWRPALAERPLEIEVKRFADVRSWSWEARSRGLEIAGTVLSGGGRPWTDSSERPLSPPVSVLFGEETRGLSPEAVSACGALWTLPLAGGTFYTLGQATALILGGAPARV
ncbi:MAG TPA: TrmH family RNA methyltransferase [Planctomycetota bacterium]|nr:TrmH family RNA methyltransferase [Planctomycetota bacterium]